MIKQAFAISLVFGIMAGSASAAKYEYKLIG